MNDLPGSSCLGGGSSMEDGLPCIVKKTKMNQFYLLSLAILNFKYHLELKNFAI